MVNFFTPYRAKRLLKVFGLAAKPFSGWPDEYAPPTLRSFRGTTNIATLDGEKRALGNLIQKNEINHENMSNNTSQ